MGEVINNNLDSDDIEAFAFESGKEDFLNESVRRKGKVVNLGPDLDNVKEEMRKCWENANTSKYLVFMIPIQYEDTANKAYEVIGIQGPTIEYFGFMIRKLLSNYVSELLQTMKHNPYLRKCTSFTLMGDDDCNITLAVKTGSTIRHFEWSIGTCGYYILTSTDVSLSEGEEVFDYTLREGTTSQVWDAITNIIKMLNKFVDGSVRSIHFDTTMEETERNFNVLLSENEKEVRIIFGANTEIVE